MVLNASVSFIVVIFDSDQNYCNILPWWLSFSLDFVFFDRLDK